MNFSFQKRIIIKTKISFTEFRFRFKILNLGCAQNFLCAPPIWYSAPPTREVCLQRGIESYLILHSIKTRPEAINKSLNSFANIYKVAPIIMKNVVVA